jgi:putative tricarboxylic transport membrane protein
MENSLLRFLTLGLAMAAGAFAAIPADAQYPDKPVRIQVGFPAGGGADILARWYADKLQKASGGTFIVENRVGASGNLALNAAGQAKPDGSTLLLASTVTTAGNAAVFKKMPIDVTKDIVPIVSFCETPFVLTVGPNSPVKSVPDLTAFIKAKGGKATYGSATTAALALTAIYLKSAGLQATHVGYKATAAAVQDVTAGQIDFAFADVVFASGQAKQGRVKLLAIGSDERSPGLPDVPSLKDFGAASGDITPLWGFWAPAGTPKAILDRLDKWLNEITTSAETQKFLISQGATPKSGTQEEYKKRFVAALKAWADVVVLAKIEAQ